MNNKEVAEIIQGLLDDVQKEGIDSDALPKKYKNNELNSFYNGGVFTLGGLVEAFKEA